MLEARDMSWGNMSDSGMGLMSGDRSRASRVSDIEVRGVCDGEEVSVLLGWCVCEANGLLQSELPPEGLTLGYYLLLGVTYNLTTEIVTRNCQSKH